MKKTTCRNLRGACDAEIQGETPEEMGQHCRQHVMEMIQSGDEDHKAAVASMMCAAILRRRVGVFGMTYWS